MQGTDSNGIISRNYSYNWDPYKEPVRANETEPSISSLPSKHTQSKVQFGWEELAGGKSAGLEFKNLIKERRSLKKCNPGSFKRNVLVLRLLFISRRHVLTYLWAVSSQSFFFFSVRETIIYESGHEVRDERDRTIYQEQDQLSINWGFMLYRKLYSSWSHNSKEKGDTTN